MKPHQLTIILGLAFTVLVGLAGTSYYYGVKYLTNGTATLRTDLTEDAQAQTDLDAITKAKGHYAKKIIPIVPLIYAALPQTKQQTAILAQIERLASANGLVLSGVTMPGTAGLPSATSQTAAAGTALALPINFLVSGTYGQLQAYLSQLETLNRSTNVTTLTVSRADPGKNISYAITLNAYVKP